MDSWFHRNTYIIETSVDPINEEPFVAHVGKKDEGMILVPGMVFTIEPMVNMGKRYVVLDNKDNWTIRTAVGSLSALWEYTVLMTEKGLEIIAC